VATRPVPEAVRAQCAALQLDLEHGERAVEVLADLTDPEDLENTLIDVLGERAERGPEGPHDPVLEDALRAALERRPASEPLWAELSVQLARREAWDEAIDARMECSGNDALARWILELRNPWYISPGHTLGAASARQLAKLAAARLGSDPRVRHEAGSLLLEAGWVDEALDILSEGGAGAVEDAVNDVARSEEILLAASERYPDSVNLRLALAESALDTGRFEDAAKTFAAIVALAPGLAHARAGEIDALRRQAQHEQAEGDEAAADIWLGEAEARLRKLPENIASEREIIAAAAAVDICRGGHVEGVRALVDLGRVDLALELMRDGGRPGPAQLAIARATLELRPDDTDLRAETGWFLMGADVPLSGNPVAALRAFEAALATKRFDTVALEGRVHALRQLGQAEAARTAVDEALARRPDAPELIWLAAQLDSDAGNSAGALRRLEAIPVDDRPDYVITGRLQALRSLRRLDQAEDEFRSALERNVRSSRLLNEAGWLAIAQGNNTVAIERFYEAYELAPTGWSERRDALFSQAVGLDSAHCYQRAQKAYKQLAQLDPSNPYPHHNLAAIYWNLGSYERARQSWQEADVRYAKGAKCAEEACAADYFSNWAMITRGVDGSFDVPVELYRKSLKLRPDQPYIAAVLASVYSDWARTGEAQPEGPTPDGAHVRTRGERFWRAWEYRDEAKRQLDRRPDFKTDFDARLKLADLSTNFEEFAEADELHDGAEELARNRLETASLLASRGVLAMRREEYPAAVRAFRQASRAEPENLEVRSNLAEALLKSGDTDSAREAYSAVLEIAPDHVEARIGLGHVFTELGESTKDESLLNRAVQSLGEALKSSASERGSKRLTDKDRAAVYYACGYARVAQLKLSGPLADRSLLKDALEDFAECTRLDKHHYKAIRAVRAIEEQRKPLSNQRLAERAGPLLVAGAALVVFLLVQASLIFGWPIGDLAPGTYGALSLGALLFVVAGLYLPNVTGLKVGTIQLEKSVVEQVSVSTDLGISK
jgi:tetratricopeptide (TPR) repeat protein